MTRSSPHGASTRQAILEAAFQLFLEQGYHGTSMRQVARQAGITPAAIYNHFEGKEALFVALLSDRVPHHAVLGALAAAQGQSARQLTHDAFQRMHQAMANQFDNLRLMFVELIEFQGRHAGALAVQFLPQLLEFVRRLKTSDPSVRSYPELILARAFLGLFMSYAISVSLLGETAGFQDHARDLVTFGDIFLDGVLEPSEPSIHQPSSVGGRSDATPVSGQTGGGL